MDSKLQKALYKKYPKIFRQKDLPMSQTCMCWGIECGNGWYQILDSLCHVIQEHVDALIKDKKANCQVEAEQVKEKYGSLRFYTNFEDDYISGAIRIASALSSRTCEDCGGHGTPSKKGWITVLCNVCRKNR